MKRFVALIFAVAVLAVAGTANAASWAPPVDDATPNGWTWDED